MQAIIIQKEQFDALLEKVNHIESTLSNITLKPNDHFIDNTEFMKLGNVSKRTLQTWRDNGLIAFSQINGKIFYKMSDIYKFLEDNKRQPFNTKRTKKG